MALLRAPARNEGKYQMTSILYAEIYLFCIIIVSLCLFWSSRGDSNSASEQWLRRMLISFLVGFIANMVFASLSPVWKMPVALAYLLKTLYHAALAGGVYAWCGYADTACRGSLFKDKRRALIASIPLLLMIALILINPWTHALFEIMPDGRYMRRGLYNAEMGAFVAVTLCFSIRLLRRSANEFDPINRSHLRLVASFPLCLIAAWALGSIGQSIPVLCVTVTIELLCLVMGTSNQQISMDKLTQVNNRQNLLGFLEFKLVNHDEKLFLLMMDLDYFKSINDNYGHLEGDDALVRAASALKQACADFKRRPYIARYGGDEFIVVVESSKSEAEALIQRIRDTLDRLNDQAGRPYRLAFSIGVGEYHPGMTANAFIEAADDDLYRIKRARPGDKDRERKHP